MGASTPRNPPDLYRDYFFTINMELAELGLEGEEWIHQLRN